QCQQARLGLTGVAVKPLRARAAEEALVGQVLDDGVIAAAAEKATEGIEPISDIHASGEFRLHLTRVYTKRALNLALSRALAGA
ncbi:MAG: xanthine dehydrogenase family protein subunit M, partial [Dehalococcoidia bacterium]